MNQETKHFMQQSWIEIYCGEKLASFKSPEGGVRFMLAGYGEAEQRNRWSSAFGRGRRQSVWSWRLTCSRTEWHNKTKKSNVVYSKFLQAIRYHCLIFFNPIFSSLFQTSSVPNVSKLRRCLLYVIQIRGGQGVPQYTCSTHSSYLILTRYSWWMVSIPRWPNGEQWNG